MQCTVPANLPAWTVGSLKSPGTLRTRHHPPHVGAAPLLPSSLGEPWAPTLLRVQGHGVTLLWALCCRCLGTGRQPGITRLFLPISHRQPRLTARIMLPHGEHPLSNQCRGWAGTPLLLLTASPAGAPLDLLSGGRAGILHTGVSSCHKEEDRRSSVKSPITGVGKKIIPR